MPGAVQSADEPAPDRGRFLDTLRELSDADWSMTSRCDAWDIKAVIQHLVSADGFWDLTLTGRHQPEPTTFLRGFDPTSTPAAVIAAGRADASATTLAAFVASTDALTAALAGIGDDEWSTLSESPFAMTSR